MLPHHPLDLSTNLPKFGVNRITHSLVIVLKRNEDFYIISLRFPKDKTS